MFSEKFLPLIGRFPQEADALTRLADYFSDIEKRHGERFKKIRLNPNRLFDISQAGSTARLATVTRILIEAQLLERRITVKLPAGGGIEFSSYDELPEYVIDPHRDVQMEVTMENIEPTYLVVSDGSL